MLKLGSLFRRGETGDECTTTGPRPNHLRTVLLAVGMLVGAPLLLFLYYKLMFVGLNRPDALDFAQLGRNMSSGRGFVTYILRPLAMHGDNVLRQPDVTHGPLFPFLLSLSFGALGVKETAVIAVSGLFYLLTIPVVYLLGKRLLNPTVGTVAALIFAFNALMLDYAVSGMHVTLYLFLMTSLFLAVYYIAAAARDNAERSEARVPRAALVFAGLLTALLYLTDPAFVWIVPVVAIAVVVMSRGRRLQATAWLALPFCVLALPWMARNAALTGNPLFGLRGLELWMNTSVHQGYDAYRLAPDEMVLADGIVPAVIKKFFWGFGQFIQSFPQIASSWILAFFLPGLFFQFSDSAANVTRRVVIASFVAVLVGTLLFVVQMPLLISAVPAMLVFAVAFLLHLGRQAQLKGMSAVMATLAVAAPVLYPLINQVVLEDKPVVSPARFTAANLNRTAGPDDVVLSDQPWLVAWNADRPSLWLPAKNERIDKVRKEIAGARWLMLTEGVRGFSPEWQAVYSQMVQWNVAFTQVKPEQQARVKGVPLPTRKGLPLAQELDGFVWTPPALGTALGTVVAAVPVKDSRTGRRLENNGPLARR